MSRLFNAYHEPNSSYEELAEMRRKEIEEAMWQDHENEECLSIDQPNRFLLEDGEILDESEPYNYEMLPQIRNAS